MKLSQFKTEGVNKKIKFINGEMVIEQQNNINGEVEFYNLDYDRLNEMNKNIIQSLKGDESDEEFAYMILPYICDCEIDVTKEEFIEMSNNPTKYPQFTQFITCIVDIVRDLFETTEKLAETQEKVDELNNRYPELKKVETKEEKIERLYNELALNKDNKELRRKIFKEISELNME